MSRSAASLIYGEAKQVSRLRTQLFLWLLGLCLRVNELQIKFQKEALLSIEAEWKRGFMKPLAFSFGSYSQEENLFLCFDLESLNRLKLDFNLLLTQLAEADFYRVSFHVHLYISKAQNWSCNFSRDNIEYVISEIRYILYITVLYNTIQYTVSHHTGR